MKLKHLFIAAILSLQGVLAGGLTDVLKKFDAEEQALNVKKLEAVEAYINADPKASDIADAYEAYYFIAREASMTDKADKFIEPWLDAALKQEKPNIQLINYLVGKVVDKTVNDKGREAATKLVNEKYAPLLTKLNARYAPRMISKLLDSIKKPKVGETIPVKFTAIDGTEVDLAKMKGKVVLIDFWATWCGPCMAEVPNVKKAYAKYHPKGFEIIGISLDGGRTPVQETIAKLKEFLPKHGMTWPNKVSGQGWKDPIASKFAVSAIPATYLIGKDGKIAATNLRGPALEKAIEKELAK